MVETEENHPNEALEDEDTEEDPAQFIPTTEIPDIILVEEDEFTEKIDDSNIINNHHEDQQGLEEAVKENTINESLKADLPRATEDKSQLESLDLDLERDEMVTAEFLQPEVEVITAAAPILTDHVEVPSSPGPHRDPEGEAEVEGDPPPPPPPKLAFQDDSSVSEEKQKKGAEDGNNSGEMPILGYRFKLEFRYFIPYFRE